MSMNRLGFTYKETNQLYFGKIIDLLNVYKHVYNFEKKYLYKLEEEITPLSEL